jgi:hypothetical protein
MDFTKLLSIYVSPTAAGLLQSDEAAQRKVLRHHRQLFLSR